MIPWHFLSKIPKQQYIKQPFLKKQATYTKAYTWILAIITKYQINLYFFLSISNMRDSIQSLFCWFCPDPMLPNIIYWILKVLMLVLSRKYSKRLSAPVFRKINKWTSKYQPVKYKDLNQNWWFQYIQSYYTFPVDNGW